MGGCSPFVIEADEVERQCNELGFSVTQYMTTLVKPTQVLARVPISNFRVGAVGLGVSGRIFMGVNLEFVGLPLNHSVHAEQCLVANAAQHGERQLRFIAVSAAPCGHCRQFLQELYGAPEINILIADERAETQSLLHFLPHRFGPDDLEEGTPLVFQPHFHSLYFGSLHSPKVDPALSICKVGENQENGSINGFSASEDLYELRLAALQAANSSHAPYSHCPSGVALRTVKGNIFKGSYTESAAFNPSLSPLQAAIIAFTCQDGGNYEDIVQAVLVEKEEALVQQGDTIKLALQKIIPKCSFHLFNCIVK
ncbi:cytidine deaminase 1 [Cryptomeria japonica]|uniref:cytidine deaminase 1 n=1 Tax=Cryptomeria japonica TaxID=3369 RepID=UPI0027DA8B0C|nr:cytidine deaminase 1 [Cryptomeria japonica]XP_057873728.2 cytidine deaminase 1 [Cryptomeria japonica]XP_057873729.2 cytidine deaminase 1 [Cryptomeria japonica]XP_057873730.2 cytidine deaminase 1 [Cryptomeria japonica]XP_057873731.2 cytidine deaminase 1 [Cryptomeria japonica]